MKAKKINIIYWVVTFIFALLMLMDGIGGVTHQEDGVVVMKHLGYPIYVMTITGVAKILGAIVLLLPIFPRLKEWAFAGFLFTFIGAIVSRAAKGDEVSLLIPPIVMIAFLFGAYALWRKKTLLKLNS